MKIIFYKNTVMQTFVDNLHGMIEVMKYKNVQLHIYSKSGRRVSMLTFWHNTHQLLTGDGASELKKPKTITLTHQLFFVQRRQRLTSACLAEEIKRERGDGVQAVGGYTAPCLLTSEVLVSRSLAARNRLGLTYCWDYNRNRRKGCHRARFFGGKFKIE